jgi:RimJ/RimL family protein N-acetyltransferase
MDIPTIETERLILRGWRESDLDDYASMAADEEVTRFIGGPISRSNAWGRIAFNIGHCNLRGFGFWAVDRKSDGKFIGRIGVFYPDGWEAVEVGWVLAKPYWGHGYATEAAKASLHFGFQQTSVAKLVSFIDPDNYASQRVAERIGEKKGERRSVAMFGTSHIVDVWEISRERWSKAGPAAEMRWSNDGVRD